MRMDEKLELVQKSHGGMAQSPARVRLQKLFDEGSFCELDALAKSGADSAEVVAGYGLIEGSPAYAFAQDSAVAGGAMSKAQAAKIKKVYGLAVKTGAPVVGVYDSAGARLKEGNEMLAAFGEILRDCNALSGVVPQVSLVLGPCIGTAAMLAASADFVVMAKNAELALATDASHGCAKCAAENGSAHLVAETEEEAMASVRRLLALLPVNNLSAAPMSEYNDAANSAEALRAAAEAAAAGDAASARAIVNAVADENAMMEISPDFGLAFVCALATVGGASCGLVASTGGEIDAASCSKAARFVRFCDAFALPLVSFVNASGFASLREAAQLSHAYAEATTVKVAVVTGAAYGAAFIALAGGAANADLTIAWPGAVISSLAPETAVAILWNDRLAAMKDPAAERPQLVAEYAETAASPFEAAAQGFINDVIDPADTRACIFNALDMLAGKRVSTLPKKHSNIQL